MSKPVVSTPLHRAKKGSPPRADWGKWVEDQIRRLSDAYSAPARQIAGRGGEKPPFWTTISRVPDSEPSEYQVTVTLGYLTYQNAGASESELGVTGYIVPKIAGVAMDDAEVEPLPLPGVVSFVYLRVKTDADGVPKFDGESVTIEAFEEAQQSIHHVRPSPSGGEEEGDYYFLLLETESNEATPTPAPRVKRRLTGNRSLPNQLVEIANIGGKREIYKGYSPGPDDKHEVRSLEQIEGEGIAIIKDLDAGDAEADPPVPAEEEGDTIPFRRINHGEREQIDVRLDSAGGTIVVEGNGFIATYADLFGGQIAFDDGLATSITPPSAEGLSASFNWTFAPPGVSDPEEMRLTFTGGVLTGATRKASGGVHEAVTNGAAVTFATYDTN